MTRSDKTTAMPPSTQFERAYAALQPTFQDLESQLYYRASASKFRELWGLLEQAPCPRVLEIGTSWLSVLLKQIRPETEVSSWDLGLGWQERCRENDIRFYQGDLLAESMPVPESSYDLVLFSEVIEHLQGNPHLALEKLHRACAPGGRLILTTPNLARLLNRLKLALGRTPLESCEARSDWGGHFREYTLAELVAMCRAVGFGIEQSYYPMYWDEVPFLLTSGQRGIDANGQFFYRPRFGGWRKLLGYPYAWTISSLARAFPSLRYGMAVVARKPA